MAPCRTLGHTIGQLAQFAPHRGSWRRRGDRPDPPCTAADPARTWALPAAASCRGPGAAAKKAPQRKLGRLRPEATPDLGHAWARGPHLAADPLASCCRCEGHDMRARAALALLANRENDR